MKREVIAQRSGLLTSGAILFLGGGSLWILTSVVTAPGGFDGFVEAYDGRGSPHFLVLAAIACAVIVAWWLFKLVSRKDPPVFLESNLLFAESWQSPLDMTAVERIVVKKGVSRSYETVFLLKDGSPRVLVPSFYKESASGIAADLGARFDLPVEDPTIET